VLCCHNFWKSFSKIINMKHCISILAFLLHLPLFSQTYTGDVLLTTDAEVATFGANNYTTINGNLTIIGTGISDLSPLASLTTINGNLDVGSHAFAFNNALTSFNGLHNIATVTGFAYFGCFESLTSLAGLASLETVDGDLTFRQLWNLLSLSGLSSNLTEVGGSLSVLQLQDATSLIGLGNITSVGGDCILDGCHNVSSLAALANLASVGSDFIIKDFDFYLQNLNGLGSLTSIGGNLVLFSNGTLDDLTGLTGLTSIGGLRIEGNGGLMSMAGFPAAITSIPGDVIFRNNNSLSNLSALSNLTAVSGDFVFWNNDAATSLAGLGNLSSVGGHLNITGNNGLPNLNGLSGLVSVDSMTISGNAMLTSISGMTSLTTITSELNLNNNNSLTSLSGLGNVTTLGGLSIGTQPQMATVSNFLGSVTSLPGNLTLNGNAALTSFQGLTSLTSLQDLSILNNPVLTNISGMANLTTVNGQFLATSNDALSGFPFCKLESIGTDLQLSFNPALTQVDAFYNLTSINDLIVSNNASLSDCSGLCNLIGNVSGSTVFIGNASPCDSPTNVENNCSPLPANDACAGATALTLNPSGSCAATVSATTDGALESLPGCNFESCPVQDVWFSFTATQTAVKLNISELVSITGQPFVLLFVEAFSGPCAGLNSLGPCKLFFGNSTQTFSGLTVGDTYYLRAYTDATNGPASFDICLQQFNTPANDNAPDAVNLTLAELCDAPVYGTVEDATQSLPNTQMCNGSFGQTANDVWYKFTASGSSATFSVIPAQGIFAPIIELIDSDQTTYLDCNYNNGSGTVELQMNTLNNGQTYYLRIFHGGSEVMTGTAAQFSACLHQLPSIQLAQTYGGSCELATVTHTSTGSGSWMHFEYFDRLMASVLDSEPMGAFTASIYTHFGGIRTNGDQVEVLGRNLELTPASQPSNPVTVRFYLTTDEYDALVAANDGDNNDINALSDFVAMRYTGEACSTTPPSGGALHPVTGFGSISSEAYFVEFSIPSFSAFYFTGGAGLLPVELTSFRGEVLVEKIRLYWATASELNNLGFEVQRSMDGLSFEKIAWKSGRGSSQSTATYTHDDAAVLPGQTYYYRLRQVDVDGRFSFSKTIGIRTGNGSTPRIFPNPAGDFLFVEIPKHEGIFSVEITSPTGQLVRSEEVVGASMKQVSLAGLPDGLYLVSVKNNGLMLHRERVFVAR
jgi:hypothetical protein